LAARVLRETPDLIGDDLYLACAAGQEGVLRKAIAADPACVNREAPGWRCPGCKKMLAMPPLVAVTHSALVQVEQFREQLYRSARLLLEAGADPNQFCLSESGDKLSALYGAAGKNHDPEMTRILLEAGAEPNDGESLYHSLEARDRACTRMLLEAGARTQEANAICHQLDKDDLEGLRLILRFAPGVEDRELIWAIRRARSREHVALLLEAGANPLAKTAEGISAFRFAMQMGLADVAQALREASAGEELDVSEQFVAACAAANEEEARRVLAANPGVIESLSEAQLKQLPQMVEAGKHDAARVMVRVGWPIGVRGGDWGGSALNHAVYQGQAGLVRFLLEHGASWEEENNWGDVLGMLAWASRNMDATNDYVGCARVLIEFGAPLLETNDYYSEEMEEFLAEARNERSA
jgi:ankyrin repeat protein